MTTTARVLTTIKLDIRNGEHDPDTHSLASAQSTSNVNDISAAPSFSDATSPGRRIWLDNCPRLRSSDLHILRHYKQLGHLPGSSHRPRTRWFGDAVLCRFCNRHMRRNSSSWRTLCDRRFRNKGLAIVYVSWYVSNIVKDIASDFLILVPCMSFSKVLAVSLLC
jgi:hypothetical protein